MLTALSGFASSYRMVKSLTTGLGGRSADMDGLMTGLGYNPSSRWNSVRWVARVVWSRVPESRPCCWRPRTAAAGGRPQAGLEDVEKLLPSGRTLSRPRAHGLRAGAHQ